jgi:hypothetical protein
MRASVFVVIMLRIPVLFIGAQTTGGCGENMSTKKVPPLS